ncbi:hypothetical protein [Vibrio gazogenes]|uniref:Uncharacterized protein n=1 Tax=Vibrio gazogenes TaxID=687 RepID=A0A1Z2SBL6_VIBGA|nr:hypothetical protein [Vibrio gazogenes]ASA54574.1 hypothetical protein BSQ33_01705 [Vibrio gazogenes]
MNRDIKEQLKILTSKVESAMIFESDDDEEEYKVNKESKEEVFDFILGQYKNFKDELISESDYIFLFEQCMGLLANNTGCAEDMEILESILDRLYDMNIIDQNCYRNIVESSSLGRWLD